MVSNDVLHNWLVDHLRTKLSRDYREIRVNFIGDEQEAFKDVYPDLILGNQGMVMALMEVETEETITEARAAYWKQLSQSGVKVFLMVPDHAKAKVTDLLWKSGIMHSVSIGSYSLKVSMP